jgi:VanZ family protein
VVDSKSTDKRRVWLWAYAPLVLWLGVIFYLSSPEGAFSNTSRIIGPLLQFFFPDMPEATRMIIHGYVRKAAHFTEYAVFAFLGIRALTMSSSSFLRSYRYLLPLVLVAVVAMLDEYNQSFLASRTSSVYDVLIDIAGGTVMTALLWVSGRPRDTSDDAEFDETAVTG